MPETNESELFTILNTHIKSTGNAATLDMSGLNLFFDLCVMILDKAFCYLDWWF